MKTTRKVFAIALSLVMVFALAISAFAANEYSITIDNKAPNHVYEAYQIFAGDLSTNAEGTKVLSNITWGSGVDQVKLVDGKTVSDVFAGQTAEEIAAGLKTEDDAKAFAAKVAPYLKNAKASAAQANDKYVISGLDAGYYLVKDQNNTLQDKDDFYTAYIMKVVADVSAAPKGDKPSLDKQIKHNESGTWGVVGDNQIGDTVEFRTITTVPDTTGYDTYVYKIHDTMSVGLTSNVSTAADITIKVNDAEILDAKYYTVTANGNSFTVNVDILAAINDGVLAKNDSLYTYYTGVLNADAKVYDEGKQENVAYLEYSNNPNDEGTGRTKEVKVYDWTFKMGVNKVDENGNALTGAKFVLSKNGALKVSDLNCNAEGIPTNTADLIALVKVSDGVYRVATDKDEAATIVYDIDAGNVVINGLDDAITYYLYETKAPEGYNLLKTPVEFKITAEYNADGASLKTGSPTVTVGAGEPSATLSTDVVNNSGSTLPETGGIGTTIFYIAGALLVVAAGIILVTRKRMSSKTKA